MPYGRRRQTGRSSVGIVDGVFPATSKFDLSHEYRLVVEVLVDGIDGDGSPTRRPTWHDG